MARQARLKSSTGIYHVMLRGINKQPIFKSDDDRDRFIAIVCKYCLMDNHVHLLIQEADDNISKLVKRISSSYVFWYNQKHERIGHLFQDRFKSECVEDDNYFLGVLRYIHQNPVKAGMVKSIDRYNWSSYYSYIEEIDAIDYRYGLSFFSENTAKAKPQFIKYMNEENIETFLDDSEPIKVTDEEVELIILSMGFNKLSDLKSAEKETRRLILKELKSIKGVSIRQLSRITGLSRLIITEA